jgi:sulfur transfer complex TusBCD TusB component (DsrH family)
VKENGVNVAEMQAKLLQKIEELTLYVIQHDLKHKGIHWCLLKNVNPN